MHFEELGIENTCYNFTAGCCSHSCLFLILSDTEKDVSRMFGLVNDYQVTDQRN
jgi:hypothetical protein